MPTCTECGEPFPRRRAALGYRTCLTCGEVQARTVKRCVAPLNKSNYVLISNVQDLKGLNPKRVEA